MDSIPAAEPTAFENSQKAALKIGNAYPSALFCTFSANKKTLRQRDGTVGVSKETTNLYTTDDIYSMESIPHGDYLGLFMQHPTITPQGHFVVLDIDLKRSETAANIAIQRMANWTKTNNAMVERSISGKGRHIFLICKKAENILKKYTLAAGQEVEVFGLESSVGKSLLLTGDKLQGEIIEVDDLHALLSEWGIIEQHNLNQPVQKVSKSPPMTNWVNPTDEYTKAAQALNYISADIEYNQWIELGQALHTAFGANGYALWDDWSSQGLKYKGQADIETHWKSFHIGKGIGLGTLFHTARENGYLLPTKTSERQSAVQDFKSIIKSGIKAFTSSSDEPAPGWHERTLAIGELKPIRYMIKGFWAHSFMVLAGQPGIGKTTAIISLCMVMAGIQIKDCQLATAKRRKTIIVTEDSEQVERTLTGYARHFGISANVLTDWFVVIDAKRVDVSRLLLLSHNVIKHTIDGVRPLLVLDTANATMDIDNENDNSEVGAYIAAIKQTIYTQLDTPVIIITHTNKTISKEDDDATARGASAFSGDATLTAILFQDSEKNRFMRLVKTRYQPNFREVKFISEIFTDIVIDENSQPQDQAVLLVTPEESNETDRKTAAADRKDDKRQQAINDKCDEICNYVQSVLNTQGPTIMRRGSGRPKIPKELLGHYQLEWESVYSNVKGGDSGYVRKAIGNAIFTRFAPSQPASGWVILG